MVLLTELKCAAKETKSVALYDTSQSAQKLINQHIHMQKK